MQRSTYSPARERLPINSEKSPKKCDGRSTDRYKTRGVRSDDVRAHSTGRTIVLEQVFCKRPYYCILQFARIGRRRYLAPCGKIDRLVCVARENFSSAVLHLSRHFRVNDDSPIVNWVQSVASPTNSGPFKSIVTDIAYPCDEQKNRGDISGDPHAREDILGQAIWAIVEPSQRFGELFF